jgi:hypothetical protein
VSRFLPESLLLGIEPDCLTLVRYANYWPTRISDAESIPLSEGEIDTTALVSLEQELRTARWQARRIQIVLADSLVRYFIAPFPHGARNAAEVRKAAVLRFEEIYGDEAGEWTISIDPAPFASNNLGCAVRSRWLAETQRICREHKLMVSSITPFAVSEFNRSERRIGSRSGWFAVWGKNTLWLAFKEHTGWRTVHVHPRIDDGSEQLPRWLEQDKLRAGIDEQSGIQLWLTGLIPGTLAPVLPASMTPELLGAGLWPGRDEHWSQTFRLALSSVWPTCA